MANRITLALAAALAAVAAGDDKTWNNGSGNFLWDTTSPNWTGSLWSNGDAANFGFVGAGTLNVQLPIDARSFIVRGGNYTFAGPSSLSYTTGTGSLGAGYFYVEDTASAAVNVPLTSTYGLIKYGPGTLRLGAPVALSGTVPITGGPGAVNFEVRSGTAEVTAASVLPATTSVAIGNGYLNIGAFATTLGSLTLTNTVAGPYQLPFGTSGVHGAGPCASPATLRRSTTMAPPVPATPSPPTST